MFKKNENEKSIEWIARYYYFLQRATKIMALLAGIMNGAIVGLMLKDWNGGAILFIINLLVCFALYYKINRELVKNKREVKHV